MALYKKQPFPLAEKPNDLMPNERVFQVHVTNELFRDYSEYLKRINLYRRRVWTSKASGKTNLSYEEALVSEKKAAEKFPKDFVALVLCQVQFSMLPLRDLVNAIFKKLQGPLSEGNELYARKNNQVYPCKIVKVLEGADRTEYKVLWLGKDKKVTGNSLIKGLDLIEKLPFSKEDLKSFIMESTYCYSPWVLHDNLAKSHGISTHPPECLGVTLSTYIQNGQVVCSRKRKKAEDEKTLPGQSQSTTTVCSRKREKAEDEKTTTKVGSRKREKAEDEKTLPGQSQTTTLVVCSRKRKKAENEKTLPGQSQTTTEVCSRKREKAEFEKTLPGQSETTTEECSRKRKKAEDEKTLPGQSQTTTEECSRKRKKDEDEKALNGQSQTTTGVIVVCSRKREKAEDEKALHGQSQTTIKVCRGKMEKVEDEKTLPGQSQTTTEVCSRKREKTEDENTLYGQSQTTTKEDVPAPDILIKKMPNHKRGHADAKDSHVKASKDIPQPKKLRVKAAEKSSDEQKEPLEDPIAGTICQRRFVPVKQTGNFGKLPYELLVEVAKRLKLLEDFTCFRSVSRSLHLFVEEEYFDGLRVRKSLPYLMLPPGTGTGSSIDGSDDDDIRQLYSLVEGESIVASLKFPGFKTNMCFESLGWLLTIEVDGSMSLLDPFSVAIEEIPVSNLNTIPRIEQLDMDKRIIIRKMALSSRPNENSDFIMMVVIGDYSDLAFWRLGDKAWNRIDDQRRCFLDVVYGGGGQFYAMSSKGIFWVINLAAGNVECRIIVDCGEDVLHIDYNERVYILKAINNGSVLVVKRIKDEKFYVTSEFQVYEIDIKTGKWTRIYSLGSMAVFVGRNSSLAVDATVPSYREVVKANHIYFTDDFVEHQHVYFNYSNWREFFSSTPYPNPYAKGGSVDCGVFNFQTGDIEPVYPVEPLLKNVSPAMWITPNLCF